MDETEHRITKLEVNLNSLHDTIAIQNKILTEIRNETVDIKEEISKVKGFSTGVAAAFTVIGAAFTFIWDEITRH